MLDNSSCHLHEPSVLTLQRRKLWKSSSTELFLTIQLYFLLKKRNIILHISNVYVHIIHLLSYCFLIWLDACGGILFTTMTSQFLQWLWSLLFLASCNSLTIFCSFFLPSCFNDVLDINQGTAIFSSMKYIHFSCILSICNNSHLLIQRLMMDRYKLCYYRFGELTTEYGKPPG